MIDLLIAVKTLGVVGGFLLISYGFVIAGADRYEEVSDKYASAISTVGLIMLLVAVGGFFSGSLFNLVFEGAAYVIGIVGGTWALRRIGKHKPRFEEA